MIVLLCEDVRLGCVEDEMLALGAEFTDCFVEHCRKVETGAVDVRRLAPFAELEGVPIFRASVDTSFVIYAVETVASELTFIILVAGRHGAATTFGPVAWDGLDYEGLKRDVVLVRAAATYLQEGDVR